MKRKWMMAVMALAVTGCMITACGNGAGSETEAKTEIQTESGTEVETASETETETVSETETESISETETEEMAAEPKTMYVVSDVYVRQEADAASEAVSVAHLGDEVEAVPEGDKWYKVKLGDQEGYVAKDYLTDKKEEADQAVKAEEAAKAAAQAAEAAQQSQQSQPSGGGVYEVSRQAFDDCDGSGHGYYEITYSDGSVKTEEY